MHPFIALSYYVNHRPATATEFWFWVLGFIAIVVGLRLWAGRLDRARIRETLAEEGSTVLDISWSPFGPGWFGEKSDRIYEVRYRTRAGREIVRTCKTSMFTGVYWHKQTDDVPPVAKHTCKNCRQAYATPANFCPHCGTRLC